MNCYDCEEDGVSRPRSQCAFHCGAGICGSHATVTTHNFTRVELINRVVPVEPPARHIYCDTCAAAIEAQQRPHQHAVHFPHSHD